MRHANSRAAWVQAPRAESVPGETELLSLASPTLL